MRSRYSVLIGLLVATVALVGGTAAEAAITTPPCFACSGFVTGEPLQEPQRFESANGSLSASLTAKLTTTTVGGRTVRGEVYNGQFPGPTLVISPGDQFNVLLRNRMQADYLPYGASSLDPPPIFPGQPYAGFPQPLGNITNLHVHGLHVSPKAPGDDVLLAIKPGGQYQYQYPIPADHASGLFWYHPHHHQYTDMQVSQGQAGAIIVRGGLDEIAGIKGLRDRVMVIQNVQVKNGAKKDPGVISARQRPLTEKCCGSIVDPDQLPPHPQPSAANARTTASPGSICNGLLRMVRSMYGFDALWKTLPFSIHGFSIGLMSIA